MARKHEPSEHTRDEEINHVPFDENVTEWFPDTESNLHRRRDILGTRAVVITVGALSWPLCASVIAGVMALTTFHAEHPVWAFFCCVIAAVIFSSGGVRHIRVRRDEMSRIFYLRMLIPLLVRFDYDGPTDVLTLSSLPNRTLRKVRAHWKSQMVRSPRTRAQRKGTLSCLALVGIIAVWSVLTCVSMLPQRQQLAEVPVATVLGAALALLASAYSLRSQWNAIRGLVAIALSDSRDITSGSAP